MSKNVFVENLPDNNVTQKSRTKRKSIQEYRVDLDEQHSENVDKPVDIVFPENSPEIVQPKKLKNQKSMKVKRNRELTEKVTISTPKDTKKIRKCSNCDFASEYPHTFQRHANSLRTCSQCSKKICGPRSKIELIRHEKTHIGKVKVVSKCEYCNRIYPHRSNLKRHLLWSKCGRL